MAKTLQFRRGTTAEIGAITGAEGELFVDLEKKSITVMDGSTQGGHLLQPQLVSGTNIKTIDGTNLLGSGNVDIANKPIILSGAVTGTGSATISVQVNGNVIGATELNVSGNGTIGQVLSSNGDGSFSWVNPTQGGASDLGNLSIANSTISTIDSAVTINSNLNIQGDLVSTGSGTPELFSDNDILLTANDSVIISASPIRLASFTTGERNALIAQDGDLIYNKQVNKFQGYANGAWRDLH